MKQLARGGRWRWRWRQRWEVARKQSRAAGVVIHTPSWHPVGSIARTCLFAPTCLPSTNNSIAAAVLVRLPKMILNSWLGSMGHAELASSERVHLEILQRAPLRLRDCAPCIYERACWFGYHPRAEMARPCVCFTPADDDQRHK